MLTNSPRWQRYRAMYSVAITDRFGIPTHAEPGAVYEFDWYVETTAEELAKHATFGATQFWAHECSVPSAQVRITGLTVEQCAPSWPWPSS